MTLHYMPTMQRKSIIVHFPIDVTKTELYPCSTDTQHTCGAFDPTGFDLRTAQDSFSDKCASFCQDSKNKLFTDKGQTYEQRVTDLVTQTYYNEDPKTKDVLYVHCWHCARRIEWPSCGIPVDFKNNTFIVIGHFCTLNCALTYNYNSNEWENIVQHREGLIRKMHKTCHPDDPNQLMYAAPRESLRFFGGIMSYEDFHLHNKYVKFLYVPQIPLSCAVEENVPIADFSVNMSLK